MKFYCANLLALAAINGAAAFTAQPTAFKSTKLMASYSYLGDLNGPDGTKTTAPIADTPTKPGVNGSTPTGSSLTVSPDATGVISTEEMWETLAPVTVQGGSLRTCSFDEDVQRVEVFLKTEGRPLNANVELWQGKNTSVLTIFGLFIAMVKERTLCSPKSYFFATRASCSSFYQALTTPHRKCPSTSKMEAFAHSAPP